VPWDSVKQFKTIRELLIGYSQKKDGEDVYAHNCLITKNDYHKFSEYVEAQTQDTKRWLRNPMSRLKQELCAAFHKRQAGFEVIRYDNLDGHGDTPRRFRRQEIIFQRDIVEMFNDVGIECQRHDLKNATNRVFTPHNVPDVEGTRELLRRLKEKYVPYLDTAIILSRPSELNISIDWDSGTPLN